MKVNKETTSISILFVLIIFIPVVALIFSNEAKGVGISGMLDYSTVTFKKVYDSFKANQIVFINGEQISDIQLGTIDKNYVIITKQFKTYSIGSTLDLTVATFNINNPNLKINTIETKVLDPVKNTLKLVDTLFTATPAPAASAIPPAPAPKVALPNVGTVKDDQTKKLFSGSTKDDAAAQARIVALKEKGAVNGNFVEIEGKPGYQYSVGIKDGKEVLVSRSVIGGKIVYDYYIKDGKWTDPMSETDLKKAVKLSSVSPPSVSVNPVTIPANANSVSEIFAGAGYGTSNFQARKSWYEANYPGETYTGSEAQNKKMLADLKSGTIKLYKKGDTPPLEAGQGATEKTWPKLTDGQVIKNSAELGSYEPGKLYVDTEGNIISFSPVSGIPGTYKVNIESKGSYDVQSYKESIPYVYSFVTRTYYVTKEGKVYYLSGNQLILVEKGTEAEAKYLALKKANEGAGGASQPGETKPVPKVGAPLGNNLFMGDNNEVYFVDPNTKQTVKVGTWDKDKSKVRLEIENPQLNGMLLDPKSGILYSEDGKTKIGSKVRITDNGNYQYTDKEGKKHFYNVDPTSLEHTEITDKKNIIMYQNGAYSYTDIDGKTVMVTPFRNEIKGVKPDGAGGWIDKDGNHFMGDGSVLTQKDGKWTFSTDTNSDGTIDSDKPSREYKDCQKSTLGIICEAEDGKIFICNDFKICATEPTELNEEQLKEIGPFGMLAFGNLIGNLVDATSGYSGMSLLYPEPDPIIVFDEWFSNLLGGIDGWSSLICTLPVSDSDNNGATFSPLPGGAYAHIEGEKMTTYANEGDNVRRKYFYKISFQVYGGAGSSGCDIKFSVRLKNDVTKSLFKKKTGGEYVFTAKKDNESISYAGNSIIFTGSEHEYEQICIYFKDIEPKTIYAGGSAQNCLLGIEIGEELCSTLKDAGQRIIDIKDPCATVGLFIPTCWGYTQGSGEGGTADTNDEAEPENPDTTEDAPVIDI